MRVAIIGSIYGDISNTYRQLGKFVYDTGQDIEWVLSTGNFGIWPDPLRADRASRNQPGEFLDYLVGKKQIPIPTLLVGGKHEDHLWIERMVARGDAELVHNLHFLVSGNHTFIENLNETLRIIGIGGTYSPDPGRGNYSMKDIYKACAAGPMDILLSHEAPDGECFGTLMSQAKGLNKVCFAVRPGLLFHGKYAETKFYRTKQTDTPAICVGNRKFVVLDIGPGYCRTVYS